MVPESVCTDFTSSLSGFILDNVYLHYKSEKLPVS